MNGWVFEVTAEEFASKVLEKSKEVPVLVDFWAEWCAPCKMLMPVLAQLADAAQGKWLLAKVNTDAEQQLAMNYQVRSLPTVKLFRDAQPIDEFMGALPESAVKEFLDKHLDRASDQMAAEAMRLAEAGDTQAALAALEHAIQDDPDNDKVVLQRLELLLDCGDYTAVEEGLAALPIAVGDSSEVSRLRARLRFHRMLSPREDGSKFDPRRRQGARALLEGEYDKALSQLFELMRTEPKLDGGAPKKDILAAFELIPDAELVAGYRRQLFNLLH